MQWNKRHEETECSGIRDPCQDEIWRWSETGRRRKDRKVSNRTPTPGRALGGVAERVRLKLSIRQHHRVTPLKFPQGYAPGYASGKFKKYLPSGYALGYASGKCKKIFALRLCLGLRLRQNFRKFQKNFEIFKKIAAGYAPGYASGNFKKIFTLWLRPRLCLRQNFRYAWGYAPGNIGILFNVV
ncbi:hypothetical protein T06_13036 [Trichinella sp. T6]|nr:hypothetical protein T06_13036 [Trichinella sp. T6]